jgi:hypothetical protein
MALDMKELVLSAHLIVLVDFVLLCRKHIIEFSVCVIPARDIACQLLRYFKETENA